MSFSYVLPSGTLIGDEGSGKCYATVEEARAKRDALRAMHHDAWITDTVTDAIVD